MTTTRPPQRQHMHGVRRSASRSHARRLPRFRCGALGLWLSMAVLAPAEARAQAEFSLAGRPVQIHSFGSQGFLYSNQNNYLTTNSSAGSFALTDAGANIQMRVTPRLRVGAQVYTWNVGQLNKWRPQLDWALVDYHFRDWLGVRAGKVKTALGLYNDTQDMQFLHLWALLPQSAYPADLRDNFISHIGGDLYGNVGLGRAGSFSYTAYAGRGANNSRGGYYYSAADNGFPIKQLATRMEGFDVRWNTPVAGLMFGTSWMNRNMSLQGTALASGLPFSGSMQPQHLTAAYADYSRGRLHLSGEFRRNRENLMVSGLSPTPSYLDISDRAFFVAAAVRLNRFWEVGAYHSRFYVDQPQAPGSAANHIFDQVITARMDFTSFWHLKVEGHFLDGYGDLYSAHGFYLRSNPLGTQPATRLLVLRSGFNF